MSSHKSVGKKIGAIYRSLRKRKGLTQDQLAEAMGVSKQTIGNLEGGSPSSFKNMVKMLEYYGELERLESALNDIFKRVSAEGAESKEQVKYETVMAKVAEGERLNIEEFEFCIEHNPRKEYPVRERILPAIRRGGFAVRYEQDEDEYYATSMRFLKELKRRNDKRFYIYRVGENSELAYLDMPE